MKRGFAGMSMAILAATASLAVRAAPCDTGAATAAATSRPAPCAKDAPRPADMAQAGVGSLDAAVGTQISNRASPAWLAVPASLAAPDSSVAWIFGLGFLGFVVARRVRAMPAA